ncbi:MAG TPA: hypothetical protein VFG20_17460 [Planctomycetaceae bacterium]|nr:hypothetical protein [Planctomycetaceae bacterium]
MSVSLTGSRSPDDRRRRRLAAAGDGTDVGDLDAGGIALLRERIGEFPSASPWLPRQPWKRNLLIAALWTGIFAIAAVLIRPLPPHPQIAPAIEHLAQGSRPILGIYADILLWTLAGQFAGLIGWYRSHSQLDFQGRYRVWAWAAVVLTAWGFFAGTSLHTAIASVAAPQLRWPLWRAEVVVWLVPAVLAGLSVWGMADRDLQRHRLGLWLVRSAALVLLLSGAGELFAADMQNQTWFPPAQLLCRFAGVGLLITGLWSQAWFVAYVNADPPEARAPIDWRGHLAAVTTRAWNVLSLLGWLRNLWPFRRRVVDAKPKRRTTKKAEEDEEAPKRRRKPAAKKRAPAKPRTRTKPEPEPEYEEEEAAEYEEEEDTWEEVDDSSAESDDEWAEEYEEEPAPSPVKAPARSTAPAPVTVKSAPPPPPKPAPAKAQSEPEYSDDEDDEDGDDSNFRVDGGKSGQDMFKGLSKRQRRELKKQMKDQGRG